MLLVVHIRSAGQEQRNQFLPSTPVSPAPSRNGPPSKRYRGLLRPEPPTVSVPFFLTDSEGRYVGPSAPPPRPRRHRRCRLPLDNPAAPLGNPLARRPISSQGQEESHSQRQHHYHADQDPRTNSQALCVALQTHYECERHTEGYSRPLHALHRTLLDKIISGTN